MDQGIITGSVTGLTYLLTVTAHDSVEALAARVAPSLPLPAGLDAARRERAAVLALNLGLVPVGTGIQRLLVPRAGEPTLRAVTRQVAWRSITTGLFGSTLTAAGRGHDGAARPVARNRRPPHAVPGGGPRGPRAGPDHRVPAAT